jgi:hypothetical protein
MSAAEPNHDPALSAENGPGSSSTAGPSSNGARPAVDTSPIQLVDLDSSQIMLLLRHLPEVFTKVCSHSIVILLFFALGGLDFNSNALLIYIGYT